MGTAAGSQPDGGIDTTGPHPGGVHDGAGTDMQVCAGEGVVEGGAVAGDVAGFDAGEDPRPVRGGSAGESDDEPGVVDELTVVGEEATA